MIVYKYIIDSGIKNHVSFEFYTYTMTLRVGMRVIDISTLKMKI